MYYAGTEGGNETIPSEYKPPEPGHKPDIERPFQEPPSPPYDNPGVDEPGREIPNPKEYMLL